MSELTEMATGQVFRLEGDYWTITFAATTLRLRDTVGLRYLALLLHRPHTPIAAFALVEEVRSAGRSAAEREHSLDDRPDAAARERARVNVTRAVGGALKRIAGHHAALGAHLRATVRTGNVCIYTPDPRLPTRWEASSTQVAGA